MVSIKEMLPIIALQPTAVGSVELFVSSVVEKLRAMSGIEEVQAFTDELGKLGGEISSAVVSSTTHENSYQPAVTSPYAEQPAADPKTEETNSAEVSSLKPTDPPMVEDVPVEQQTNTTPVAPPASPTTSA